MAKIRKKIIEFPNAVPTTGSAFLYAKKNPNNTYTTSNTTLEQLVSIIEAGLTPSPGGVNIESVTHAELILKMSGATLVVGTFYLIIDYQTIYDQPDYDAAGVVKVPILSKTANVEPLIVVAVTTYSLASTALSTIHFNDRIQYDASIVQTEHTSKPCKGRIIERIDDRNNRTYYDHRKILFKRYETALGNGIYSSYKDTGFGYTYFTTFEDNNDKVANNYLDNQFDVTGKFVFNNVFVTSNMVFDIARDTTGYVANNKFGSHCYNNTFVGDAYHNTFKNYCLGNVIQNDFGNNTIGDYFQNNTISSGFYANNIGDEFSANTIGTKFKKNTILNKFDTKTIGNNFENYFIPDLFKVVNVNAEAIQTLGTSPISLLPAVVGKYYDNIKVLIEYDYGTLAYNNAGGNYLILWDGTNVLHTAMNLNGKTTKLISIWNGYLTEGLTNTALLLTTGGGENPTTGNGAIRVIITYSLKTFGT